MEAGPYAGPGKVTPGSPPRTTLDFLTPVLFCGTPWKGGLVRESISISLPEEVKAELDRFSEREGVSRSDTVRAALQEYLFVRRLRALRAGMIPYAEAQGVFTDDDVFRVVS